MSYAELQKQFVVEAEKGHFGVFYGDDGTPGAMGAAHTDNLFSMEVIESDDPFNKGSVYQLHPEDYYEFTGACEHDNKMAVDDDWKCMACGNIWPRDLLRNRSHQSAAEKP